MCIYETKTNGRNIYYYNIDVILIEKYIEPAVDYDSDLTWNSESSARSFFDLGPGTGVSTTGAVYSPGHSDDAILTEKRLIINNDSRE